MVKNYDVKNNNIFIGIDVSKATLDISVIRLNTDLSNKQIKQIKIQNNQKSILNFIDQELILITNQIKLCVLESTGGYESLVLKLLLQNNVPTHRAHPNRVYAFAKASNHFAKTDKLDAALLAKYAIFIAKEEVGDKMVNEDNAQLQSLRKVERDLECSILAYKCRLDHLFGKSASYVKKQISFAETQLGSIRIDIGNIIKSNHELFAKFNILKSYKGIGDKIASSLIAELPELGSLNHKEIANLVGVAPKTNESGKKIGKGHIQAGRFYVRKSLYMAALVASRYHDKMKIFYQMLLAKNKPAKVALVAVMRKIIICLNAMIRDEKKYSCA
jgi:transposase